MANTRFSALATHDKIFICLPRVGLNDNHMSLELQTSILKVLVYFDLFNYPVSKEEIFLFLDKKASPSDIQADLAQLISRGWVFNFNEFYSLKNDPSLIKKRIKENGRAQSLLIIANKISKFLFRFPFVRGIGISGSLSKNVAGEDADIDFFIITKTNRLWIARTIMHAFKKLTFISGHQHWFCMNYFVDEESMEIEERNIFTATELVTLLPVCGKGTMEKFSKANNWSTAYFPNYALKETIHPNIASRIKIKKAIEFLFNNTVGDWLDNYWMRITTKRWKKKEEKHKLNMKGTRMGLKTGKHYSKPNPVFFQEKILSLYNSRLSEYEKKIKELSAPEYSILFS